VERSAIVRGVPMHIEETRDEQGVESLHVEYAERETEYGILFIFSLFCK